MTSVDDELSPRIFCAVAQYHKELPCWYIQGVDADVGAQGSTLVDALYNFSGTLFLDINERYIKELSSYSYNYEDYKKYCPAPKSIVSIWNIKNNSILYDVASIKPNRFKIETIAIKILYK